MTRSWHVSSINALKKIAAEILKVPAANRILFYGNLGAGKTTFIKEICGQLGVTENVSSPTFSIVHEYAGTKKIYHFDLYRINKVEELMEIGFEEYLESDASIFIEWPEIAAPILSQYQFARVRISVDENHKRSITLEA
ncbi:MAG: tRNA (adenosine(37)-N6)-threonylcarbamoyltransferase complex ATPase subunit type 1 TsaE [Chitinophagales bacterium]|nr:tRNA (adenosine(37)-N6)-threonylcarbamoyltransferase complex ATPase subunit type 1 TsaE [Chitinophagales bacterium]